MPPAIDLTGKKFGRLTVLHRVENNKHGMAVWMCKCDCGVKRTVVSQELRNGSTKSCGCLRSETTRVSHTVHGFRYHPVYDVWSNMKTRCLSDNKNYGGRGIKICNEWLDITNFIKWAEENGWKQGLQIDRIDNDGNYCPENCRFVTSKENINNSRIIKSNNTSGYRGVSFNRRSNKYSAWIGGNDVVFDGKSNKCLGLFNTPEEAAKARDRFIIEHNLPYRKLQILKRP